MARDLLPRGPHEDCQVDLVDGKVYKCMYMVCDIKQVDEVVRHRKNPRPGAGLD